MSRRALACHDSGRAHAGIANCRPCTYCVQSDASAPVSRVRVLFSRDMEAAAPVAGLALELNGKAKDELLLAIAWTD